MTKCPSAKGAPTLPCVVSMVGGDTSLHVLQAAGVRTQDHLGWNALAEGLKDVC